MTKVIKLTFENENGDKRYIAVNSEFYQIDGCFSAGMVERDYSGIPSLYGFKFVKYENVVER